MQVATGMISFWCLGCDVWQTQICMWSCDKYHCVISAVIFSDKSFFFSLKELCCHYGNDFSLLVATMMMFPTNSTTYFSWLIRSISICFVLGTFIYI